MHCLSEYPVFIDTYCQFFFLLSFEKYFVSTIVFSISSNKLNATRINDKINRINSLITTNKQEVKDESLNDTIMDLANYAILWLVDRKNNSK